MKTQNAAGSPGQGLIPSSPGLSPKETRGRCVCRNSERGQKRSEIISQMGNPKSSKISERKQPCGNIKADGTLYNLAECTRSQCGLRIAKWFLYAHEWQTQMGNLGKWKESWRREQRATQRDLCRLMMERPSVKQVASVANHQEQKSKHSCPLRRGTGVTKESTAQSSSGGNNVT